MPAGTGAAGACASPAEILARIGRELGAAAGGAEIVGAALMLGAVRRRVRIDRHAADRIDHMIRRSRAAASSANGDPIFVLLLLRRLRPDTPRGYIGRMRKEAKASCLKRLSRIEGQVRGLARMVEEDRYCIDIVTQIAAVRAALRRVEEEILRRPRRPLRRARDRERRQGGAAAQGQRADRRAEPHGSLDATVTPRALPP